MQICINQLRGFRKAGCKNNTNLNGENMSYQNENRSSKNDMKMEKEKLNKE